MSKEERKKFDVDEKKKKKDVKDKKKKEVVEKKKVLKDVGLFLLLKKKFFKRKKDFIVNR